MSRGEGKKNLQRKEDGLVPLLGENLTIIPAGTPLTFYVRSYSRGTLLPKMVEYEGQRDEVFYFTDAKTRDPYHLRLGSKGEVVDADGQPVSARKTYY
jgi:hypothetical protein